MSLDFSAPIIQQTIVALDLEASGAYPIGFDIVEFGAVKWQNGKVIDRLQLLLKPREPMSDFIIGIHGITNEMVSSAPPISDKIKEIYQFLSGSVVIAHHAPFDQGFLAFEFEKFHLGLSDSEVLCSSLLARQLIRDIENHRLQTLVKYFGLSPGTAHRAGDDAQSCLDVSLECFKKNPQFTLGDLVKLQGKNLKWERYSLLKSENPIILRLIPAIESKKEISIIYNRGSKPGEIRPVLPLGIVRNPDGDYLMAFCPRDQQNKRFYLDHVNEVLGSP